MKNIGLITNTNPKLLENDLQTGTSFAEIVDQAMGGNTGNIGFVHGVKKLLGDRVLQIGWGDNPVNIQKHIDHIVVCCANQIGEHVDLGRWGEVLQSYDKPVTLVGLGAQATSKDEYPSIPDGTMKFLKVVSNHNVSKYGNILVRGTYTQAVLRLAGFESIPAGCPSLLISSTPQLGRKISELCKHRSPSRIAVAAGNPWHEISAHLENKLISIVSEWDGEYVVQHPLTMLMYSLGESHMIEQSIRDSFCKVYAQSMAPSEVAYWFERYSVTFTEAPAWMRFLKKYDLTIGPRYHGVALAIQSGRPGLVITIDSRTQELCDSTGIKNIALKDASKMSSAELVSHAVWSDKDGVRLDEARRVQSGRFSAAFCDNQLTPSTHAISQLGWSV